MTEEERKYEVHRLEKKMGAGSITISAIIDSSLFDIIAEALELYKEKYNIE